MPLRTPPAAGKPYRSAGNEHVQLQALRFGMNNVVATDQIVPNTSRTQMYWTFSPFVVAGVSTQPPRSAQKIIPVMPGGSLPGYASYSVTSSGTMYFGPAAYRGISVTATTCSKVRPLFAL